MLHGLPITLTSLNSLETTVSTSKESYNSPLENALEKAEHYYKILKCPLFSCDSGLYLKDVEDKDQPGVFIRRVGCIHLSDSELIDYYTKLARKYGGQLTAYYKNAIAIKIDENTIIKSDHPNLSTRPFYITDTIQREYKEGFPLDSISKEIPQTLKYKHNMREGFREIFYNLINQL